MAEQALNALFDIEQAPAIKMIDCQRCGVSCPKNHSRQIYCSGCAEMSTRESNARSDKKRRAAKFKGTVAGCKNCGLSFKMKSYQHLFCSIECKEKKSSETKIAATKERRERVSCADCGLIILKMNHLHVRCDACSSVYAKAQRKTVEFKSYINEYVKRRNRNEPRFNLNTRMRGLVRSSLGSKKSGRAWESLVGYTKLDLERHIERQFLPGMSWSNMSEWHIDHIVPSSSFVFDSSDCPGFKACWAMTNLRPLWAVDNLKKSSKILFLL